MIPNAVTETDSAGYTVFHYCNFVDMFIEIESVSRNKINISDDVFSKIFVCYPTNDFDKRVYSNSLMDKMFEICMRYDAKLTQHTFYFFSRSIHGLKLLDRNSLLREKVEDRDTVFHVFLDNIESAKRLSDYARDMRVIKYLVSRVPINSTNDFGETPSMFLPSRQRYRDFSHDLREMGADFFKENIFGKTQSSYYFTCFNDDKN